MHVSTLDESVIQDIGHAFGYYDYGEEVGLPAAFSSQDATAAYIRSYVRSMLRGGFLHTTSPRGEGYIAYKLPGEKVRLSSAWPLICGFLQSMSLGQLLHFARRMKAAGPALRDRMDKEKKPYLFVGMVCVREPYQGQGYMRKVMDLAFAEGNRLQVPVILDTDALSKCVKYQHLGMELAGVRDLQELGKLYDLIKYPDPVGPTPGPKNA